MKTAKELNEMISKMKAEQAKVMTDLLAQKAKIEAEMKQLEAEAKKAKAEALNANEAEKMIKFAALVTAGKVVLKENKSEIILGLMIKGYSKDAIIAYTNYSVKEVTDITWRIYDSYGCNPDR